ncbi:tRNA (adenosine(37)-N6)-threonylcarbamoyltransferase complex dimerization subunit type 1 TsaB [Sediminibacillus dalangtanensis]|uniref:tRNA (Adenosine(37)-N6)-threonylcarbamoyltransferase complex dimerization subunit type 1 TsaB n=1 Tax=Sediminibacillus dalangtanensis TaxID=2729421 RepID=A0ABX7VQT5_9BACI|nr:tRNA (adenosine(37)-N6)-threonylcarbamoyltransferase complex dimerization subunit type 1 TsaB [Sediminibacillus dalangtanensis]QTM98140.1 tRNA (adenosine(37)-N6)-threonylcarbamoyltransferase complex dimerization subunit type 1 TsaB [Sediminibacillus dalangtanensis]
MNILAIDTSNQVMGIAILKDGLLAGEYTTNAKKNHSVRLMPAIDQLMKETEMTPEQLDRIVVAKGPGSYTGVRIGLTTAKTMGWALDIPVTGMSSLKALALQAQLTDAAICPFFDARRGLVYTGLYKNKNGALSLEENEVNILFTEWLEKLADRGEPVVFLSPDIELHRPVITDCMKDLAIIPELVSHYPRAGYLAEAGAVEDSEPVHALTPEYLRLVEAEAKWLEQQGKN